MGWDTEVIIIAERIKNEETGKKIGRLIFEKDSKSYERELFFIIEEEKGVSIFYNYERRKVLPYWVIKEISSEFNEVKFTLLGSCPDFVGGPAALIKIENGQIMDSYGIGELNVKSIRSEMISSPKVYKKLLFDWFRVEGEEEKLRNFYLKEIPMNSCDDNFVSRLIPIRDSCSLKGNFETMVESKIQMEKWKIQPRLMREE